MKELNSEVKTSNLFPTIYYLIIIFFLITIWIAYNIIGVSWKIIGTIFFLFLLLATPLLLVKKWWTRIIIFIICVVPVSYFLNKMYAGTEFAPLLYVFYILPAFFAILIISHFLLKINNKLYSQYPKYKFILFGIILITLGIAFYIILPSILYSYHVYLYKQVTDPTSDLTIDEMKEYCKKIPAVHYPYGEKRETCFRCVELRIRGRLNTSLADIGCPLEILNISSWAYNPKTGEIHIPEL